MVKDNIVKADPRIHLEELKKIESDIVVKIKDLEHKLKMQLLELQTTRSLMEEMINEAEEKDYEEFSEAGGKISKNIEKLEEVISDFEDQKGELNISNSENPYALNKENMALVTSYDTIEKLYELAAKTEWNYNDTKAFMEIRYNVGKAKEEEFNPLISNRLESVYQAVKHVSDKKPEVNKYQFNSLEGKVKDVNVYDSKGIQFEAKEQPKYQPNINLEMSGVGKKLEESIIKYDDKPKDDLKPEFEVKKDIKYVKK